MEIAHVACPVCGGPPSAKGAEAPEAVGALAELVGRVLRIQLPAENNLVESVCPECRRRLDEVDAFVREARIAYIKLIESADVKIKEEPPDSPEDEHFSYSPLGQIKIEPLSEDDALKVHLEASRLEEHQLEGDEAPIPPASPASPASSQSEFGEIEYLESEPERTPPPINGASGPEEDECKECGLIFSNNILLRRHAIIHGKKLERCMLCGKQFKLRIQLKKHVIKDHGDSDPAPEPRNADVKMPCMICRKEYSNNESFYRHLNTHREICFLTMPGKELALCAICDQAFDNLHILSGHLDRCKTENMSRKMADADWQYGCPGCELRFDNKKALQTHFLAFHYKNFKLKYCCWICKLDFKEPYPLVQHMNEAHELYMNIFIQQSN